MAPRNAGGHHKRDDWGYIPNTFQRSLPKKLRKGTVSADMMSASAVMSADALHLK